MTDPTEVRTTSSTGGQKGVKEARYELLPTGPLELVARLYGRGAAKYDDHNWRKGYEWSKSYGAMQRHANAFWGGEDIDEELGLPHLAAVIFHAMALLEYAETHPEFDDRVTTIAKRALAGVSDVEEAPARQRLGDEEEMALEEDLPVGDYQCGFAAGHAAGVNDALDGVDETYYRKGFAAGQGDLTGGWYVDQLVDYRDPRATADSWQSGYRIQHLSTEDDTWLINATNGTQATGHLWTKYFRPTKA